MISKSIAITMLLLAFMVIGNSLAEELDVRKPVLDKEGRFWVYKDGKTLSEKRDGVKPVPPYGIPYAPYAWMPGESEAMIGKDGLDMECKQQPQDGEMCISVKVKWLSPWWVGVGFVSGPDQTMKGGPWWGKTNDGWYYDLSGLKNKRLVFYMRGENGGERVQWKVGFLAGEKYGDSLTFPIESKWTTLKKEWTRYEIALSKKDMKYDLSRVCSICFVLSQAQQTDPDAPVVFYIDSLYFD